MTEESSSHPESDPGKVYPASGSKATPALASILSETIRDSGSMPFSQFMETALYHPQYGYYSSPRQKTGKQGDFITSVSVGPCFGSLLGHRLLRFWLDTGKPASFGIIEPGAHDGTLAHDILDEVMRVSPEFYEAIHYYLVERSAGLSTKQAERLTPAHPGKFTRHGALEDISIPAGALVSNELIDAFPVEIVRFSGNVWRQLYVALDSSGEFVFKTGQFSSPDTRLFCEGLGSDFPEGYTTEFNTGMEHFARKAAGSIQSGLLITIDYGHLREDYYHPDRLTGTLQTYRNHRKSDTPLASPGECDITAHVDFSRLQDCAEVAGFHHPWFGTQARYLTEHARDWLLKMEKKTTSSHSDLVRQFQTLIHPSMLGIRFSVLEMRK